jgi:hypothetical protein
MQIIKDADLNNIFHQHQKLQLYYVLYALLIKEKINSYKDLVQVQVQSPNSE